MLAGLVEPLGELRNSRPIERVAGLGQRQFQQHIARPQDSFPSLVALRPRRQRRAYRYRPHMEQRLKTRENIGISIQNLRPNRLIALCPVCALDPDRHGLIRVARFHQRFVQNRVIAYGDRRAVHADDRVAGNQGQHLRIGDEALALEAFFTDHHVGPWCQ